MVDSISAEIILFVILGVLAAAISYLLITNESTIDVTKCCTNNIEKERIIKW
jgi:hypothetical protein